MRFAPANASSRDKGLRAFLIAIPSSERTSSSYRLRANGGFVLVAEASASEFIPRPVPERSLLLALYLARWGTKEDPRPVQHYGQLSSSVLSRSPAPAISENADNQATMRANARSYS